jgi:hypothetical protein
MMHPDTIARLRQNAVSIHQYRCLLLCKVVDEFCPPPPKREGPGRPLTFSDNMVIKMDMLGRLSGIRGETELLRHLDRHYRWLFPELPSQSWLWRRLRDVAGKIEAFRRHLCYKLGVDQEEILIIDTLPVPVFTAYRLGRGNGFDLADWGYCPSKNLHYYGFKLGLCITPSGIPAVYDLFSARPHDINCVEDLLSHLQGGIALGDKGFISQAKQDQLMHKQGTVLITHKRRNQTTRNSPLAQWLLDTYRQRIETVGSQLDDLLHIQDLGAKTETGLVKRIIGALTAFTLGIYLNLLLDRKLLAVKALFA